MADGNRRTRSQADAAFAGNRLLSTFAPEARALIEPHGTVVELEAGEIVLRRGEEVEIEPVSRSARR